MVPDQVAWYMQLLADAWQSKDTPQATLPDDDEVLKQQSRFVKSLERERTRYSNLRSSLITVLRATGQQLTADQAIEVVSRVIGIALDQTENELEQQWQTVKRQFISVATVYGPLIYSPRQIAELKRWRDSFMARSRGGMNAAEKRWGPSATQTSKELSHVDMSEPHPILDGQLIADPSVGKNAVNQGNRLSPTESTNNTETNRNMDGSVIAADGNIKTTYSKDNTDLTTQRVEANVTNNTTVNEKVNSKSVSKNDTPKSSASLVPKRPQGIVDHERAAALSSNPRKRPASLFDEERFVLTEHMRTHLASKYHEFVQGDFDYMVDKFKNVMYGKVYTSWSRTFYNFVGNQLTLYGYRPGDFNWRDAVPGSRGSAPQQKSPTTASIIKSPSETCSICKAHNGNPTSSPPCPFHQKGKQQTAQTTAAEDDFLPLTEGDIK